MWDAKARDFCIKVNETCQVQVDNGIAQAWQMLKGMYLICIDGNTSTSNYHARLSSNVLYYLVQKKNSDVFEIFSEPRLPPSNELTKQFLITDLTMY
jgi:hypothetical protein